MHSGFTSRLLSPRSADMHHGFTVWVAACLSWPSRLPTHCLLAAATLAHRPGHFTRLSLRTLRVIPPFGLLERFTTGVRCLTWFTFISRTERSLHFLLPFTTWISRVFRHRRTSAFAFSAVDAPVTRVLLLPSDTE